MVGTRWSAKYSLRWTPVLTYTRRRLELMEWFDANVNHVAFTEDHEHVGIAVETTATRLTAHRRGVTLELREVDASIDVLAEALDGVLEVLKPRDPHPSAYAAGWSCGTKSDYDEAAATLGVRSTGIDVEGISVSDCAVLFDYETEDGDGQAEFGVVHHSELAYRLRRPTVGQLAKMDEVKPTSVHRPAWQGSEDDLPRLALFVDVAWVPGQDLVVTSGKQVTESFERAESNVSRLIGALDGTV